ncbi:MAG: histidine kinase N-terminal 7TM domain-containing protein [Patescibacteria group bacterium]|jgi:hypothetical protein
MGYMYWVNLGLIFIAGLNFGLALLIWLINPKNKINITFALSVFFVAAWTLGIAMFRESQTETMALVWAWVQNGSGGLIVIPFFLFSLYFPYQSYVLKKWQIFLIILSLSVFLAVVFVPNWWIKKIYLEPSNNDYLTNRWGIGYFNLHFYFYLFLAFSNLLKKYKVSQGFQKKQLLSVVSTTGIIALFGGIFGAIIPLILARLGPYYLGPFFSLPMVIFLSRFVLKKD